MEKELSNHGAIAYDKHSSVPIRDLPDVDLSDHGAVSYSTNNSGHVRELIDADLSDHGAVSYNLTNSGHARDLIDADLSDHGAVAYAPKSVTWGTNDEDLIKHMNILMRASYSKNYEQIIPCLNEESLAKVVDFRYRQVANIIDSNSYGLGKDEKFRLGAQMYMDFLIIDNMLSSNQNCLNPIFNPSLFVGVGDLTDIFGVLENYQHSLDGIKEDIPLINGMTGELVVNSEGKSITAQETLDYLMSKKEIYKQNDSGNKTL